MGLDKYAPDGQNAVARGTGMSRSAISRIFSGERKPSVHSAERIARYLGIPVAVLWAELEALWALRRARERN